MVSLSLMITYIKHLRYSGKATHFGPFYYIQIDPQDYDERRISTPEEEIHFQTPSKLGSPATPRSMATSQASESYITLTNFKKGIKRDASAYPILKNERYYNTFIRHFKATAKAQGLNTLMDPNFTPGSDEYEQQLFQEQQDFLYSVLISSLKTDFSEALVKDHEGDAQLILELLHEHHTGNSQYSRSEINRITKYLTNIKLDDTWRGTNESFLMHYNDQIRLLDSLVDSDEKLPDNTRVTFLESAVESVPDLRRVKITDNVLQAQLDSTRPISYMSYFDLLKDAAFHLDQATKRGNKIRRTNVHFSGPNDEDEHQNLSSDDPQVIQQEDVSSEPPEPLSYSVFQSHLQGSSTSNTQKIFLPKPIWEKLSKIQQQMIIDHNRSLPKSGSSSLSTPNKSPSPLPTNLHHNRQPNLCKCTPINLIRALLTQPKLRPPLLTLCWQWSISPFTPLMMMLQTSPRSFQPRGLDRSKSVYATSSSMPITPTISWWTVVPMEALLVQICVSSTKPTARSTFQALITMKLLVLMWSLLQSSSTPLWESHWHLQ